MENDPVSKAVAKVYHNSELRYEFACHGEKCTHVIDGFIMYQKAVCSMIEVSPLEDPCAVFVEIYGYHDDNLKSTFCYYIRKDNPDD